MASLKVAVRVRPFNQREIDMGAQLIVQMDGKKTRLLKPKTSSGRDIRDNFNDFTFDFSYCSIDDKDNQYIAQDQVYEDLGTDVIECAFQGYNACVFAYGQTGSGKTFTMMGTSEKLGLIPRICKALFSRMQLKEESGIGYKTHVSYLEIYNEKVKDLLGTDTIGHGLKVREHRILGPYVENLSQHPVSDYNEIQSCIYKGNSIRTTASTNMNDTSSRSHAIFTITFVQAGFRNDMPSETVSKIHLVDLAGSERANATGATGQRLKEGAHINKSLVTLGSVISALADQTNILANNKKLSYVPYRDSVLTWLLKDSLGGNSKTIMIAAISPADCNYSETLSTLRYANRAKNIINKPTINEDPNVKLIRELREEIYKLKSMLDNDSNAIEPSLKVLEDLLKKEAQEKVLTEEWQEKWREAQNILREEKSLGLRKSGFGVVLDSEMPHLIGIHDDISTGVTLYSLKEGKTLIGTDDNDNDNDIHSIPQDIVLSGIGIYPQHCSIILHNGNATIYPNLPAQCWLNANLIEEPSAISQGDILLLGRTNMFRYNNPAEAAKLRKDPSRSRLNLSRLSLIAASRENLNSSFSCDEDNFTLSPFKRNDKPYYVNTPENIFPKEDLEIQDENKKILESIENALRQLSFERSQMYQHYKNKLFKLTEELVRLEQTQENNLAILDCKERELIARREMLLWERDNEKSQVDIVVRQLSTLQLQLEKKKRDYLEYVTKTLQELQDSGKLDEASINLIDTTPISEDSSEVLIFLTKSIDNYSAQYIKENIKKNKNDITQLETVLDDKQEKLSESTNKLCELDQQLMDLDKSKKNLEYERSNLLESNELQLKKKSLSLELTENPTNKLKLDSDTLETFHTANSDCSINSPEQNTFSCTLDNENGHTSNIGEKAMSDSGVCLDSQKIDNSIILNKQNTFSIKSTDDDNLSCFSCEITCDLTDSDGRMNALREKITMQKAQIMKTLETETNKKLLDEQIEHLQILQKDYVKMEMEYFDRMKVKNEICVSDGEIHTNPNRSSSIVNSDDSRMRSLFSSQHLNYNLQEPIHIPNLARSLPSIAPYQESEHYISIPSFLVRGAGKQTHFEYEIKINLKDGRWTLLRRYSRFRELHLSMKSCYGEKIASIPFPRRELFSSNSESVAKSRRRQLESYLRRLLIVCSKIPQSPVYEESGNTGLTKTTLILLSPFFKKGLFESGKHGTG